MAAESCEDRIWELHVQILNNSRSIFSNSIFENGTEFMEILRFCEKNFNSSVYLDFRGLKEFEFLTVQTQQRR